ncbi:MAG: hypothetical protein GX051_10660 [Clostridiales bacterium]|nr:hypothetical protein [Clostridiales bacterium]
MGLGSRRLKAYEFVEPKRRWKKAARWNSFDVMAPEGCFCVQYEASDKENGVESAKVYGQNTVFYTDKYLDAVKQGMLFYENEGGKSEAFEKFRQQFEESHKMSLAVYREQEYKEIYDEWAKKWGYNK